MPHVFLSDEAIRDLQDIVDVQIRELEKQLWQMKEIWNGLGNKISIPEISPHISDEINRAPREPEELVKVERPAPQTEQNQYLAKRKRPELKSAIPDRLLPEDIFIPRFEYDVDGKKFFENIFFWELKDGRTVIQYGDAHYYSTKEKIMKLPYPAPAKYYDAKPWNSTNEQAAKKYRKYLAMNPPGVDPDEWKYKPLGLNNTRVGKEDFEKVEGALEA